METVEGEEEEQKLNDPLELEKGEESNTLIANDGTEMDDLTEEREVEKTYLERLMIDSQITLFIMAMEKEMDIFGFRLAENENAKEANEK